MRGTPARHARGPRRAGIIPAYAGNTDVHFVLHLLVGDHPRVCGEHTNAPPIFEMRVGSSPRMRGTPQAQSRLLPHGGIIPAYAGNTPRPVPLWSRGRDHPRVCGEHPRRMGVRHVRGGSSPRMRGTLALRPAARGVGGIIPAYAGNTIHRRICKHHGRDHPRVCGEHMSVHFYAGYWQGSSPRMWGTLRRAVGHRTRHGIIPAYAGNTHIRCQSTPQPWDHPRVCGEHRAPQHAPPVR